MSSETKSDEDGGENLTTPLTGVETMNVGDTNNKIEANDREVSLSQVTPVPPPVGKSEEEDITVVATEVTPEVPPPVPVPPPSSDEDKQSELKSLTQNQPASQTPDTVEVIAPSNLPEGYELKCMLSGEEFIVIVPAGGVRGGERFIGEVQLNPLNVPRGRWRDGVFSCCALGFLDPMCWLTICCEMIVLGQVQTRESLNVFGGPGDPPKTSSTFLIMVTLSVIIFVADFIAHLFLLHDTYRGVYGVIVGIVSAVVLVVTMLTRKAIREKYKIPGSCPEDFCCAWLCTPCTICQMARHTYDYEKYPIRCCTGDCVSKTGSSSAAPIIV